MPEMLVRRSLAMAPSLAADRVADALARSLGERVELTLAERRVGCDLYRARTSGSGNSTHFTPTPLIVKVGPVAWLAHEADCLRRAALLVGALAPRLVGFAACGDGLAALAMERVPGDHVAPGTLAHRAWRTLLAGLVRLHGQGPDRPAACWPLVEDALPLGGAPPCAVSMVALRPLLAAEVQGVPRLDAAAALELFDSLLGEVQAARRLFARAPRYVHADLWPENVLVHGACCVLVDWAWLTAADYALDLANLKLLLDWAWPAWRAHLAFERVLRLYALRFGDTTLPERMRVYLPLMSLVHLVQFGRGGHADPANRAAMRACLATARRDRQLWALARPWQRIAYALGHRLPSEYAADGTLDGD